MKRMGALATLVKRDVVPTAEVVKFPAPPLTNVIEREFWGNMFSGLRPSFIVTPMPEGHQIRSPATNLSLRPQSFAPPTSPLGALLLKMLPSMAYLNN